MPGFWGWFVAAGTIVFIVWCVWLIGWSAKQGPTDKADEELVGHRWDGDLEEWNKPAPKWWLYLYFITIIWGVGYMLAYPGFAAFEGFLGWSQEGQYEDEMQRAAARYEPIYDEFAAMDFASLVTNTDALDLGASLYASYCTTCHGSGAQGAPGYPNLTDDAWIFGKTEAAITATIMNGRNNVMPAMAPALGGEAGLEQMVAYVRSLSGLTEAPADAEAARTKFTMLCGACHGPGGGGNVAIGAPNLTDNAWLYGGSEAAVRSTLVNGRNGVMPAFGELLGADRAKFLAAYVYSLSE
ncbi:MAG: cytochrome-c oxidase, cbb3-type subunit III [Woeseiaceae bacterium]|nr:cytochrome-c oxidase, cbb3-type subunit III [Woeseiaceae bacterium]